MWSPEIKTDHGLLRAILRNTFLFGSGATIKLAYKLETIWETESSPPLNCELSRSKKIQDWPTADKRTYVNFNPPLGSGRREDSFKTMAP